MPGRTYAVDLRHIHREPASAAVTADANYGDADASQAYIDMGAATNTLFTTQINIEAIKISSNDETYTFRIEVSNTSDFTVKEVAAVLSLGPTETRMGGAPDNAAGDEYQIYWCSRVNNTEYRYWRLAYDEGTGTSPSITFNAFTSRIQ